MNIRIFALLVSLLGFVGLSVSFTTPFLFERLFYIPPNLLLNSGSLIFLGAVLYVFSTLSPEYQEHMVAVGMARFPQLAFHLIFTALFVADLAFLVLFLLFPETVYSGDPKLVRDVQIFGCIGSSGLMGDFIKQLQTNLRPVELYSDKDPTARSLTDAPRASSYVRFWSTMFSLFTAFFTATVLFLLLRAGILKTVEVDTFNVYGVTGVAAISGYFSDNIMRRLSLIYEQLFETGGGKTQRPKRNQ
jgi:hypothetical protein